jgi:prepilin peptidase CpaA
MPAFSFPMLIAIFVAVSAAAIDVHERRIPNWLTGGSLLLGLSVHMLAAVFQGGPLAALSGIATSLAGAAIGLAVLLPFYMIKIAGVGRAFGAGDVKLLAALGAIAGPQVIISIVLYAAVAGGIQSFVLLLTARRTRLIVHQTLVMGGLPTFSGIRAPYGVAIAAGVVAAAVLPPVVPL